MLRDSKQASHVHQEHKDTVMLYIISMLQIFFFLLKRVKMLAKNSSNRSAT